MRDCYHLNILLVGDVSLAKTVDNESDIFASISKNTQRDG